MINMAKEYIMTSVSAFTEELAATGATKKSFCAYADCTYEESLVKELSKLNGEIYKLTGKLEEVVSLIREHNNHANIITTPWEDISGKQIIETMEKSNSLEEELLKEAYEHHHEDHEHCSCGHDHEEEHHHHHDHDEEHEHHHEHGEECGCGHNHEHEHHHHDENCSCGCGHDHHHQDADEVFTSWGIETPKKYSEKELNDILEKLSEKAEYGIILRAKGIVPDENGNWYNFDLVPGEYEIRKGEADYTGRLCVIGSKLDTEKIEKLFNIK